MQAPVLPNILPHNKTYRVFRSREQIHAILQLPLDRIIKTQYALPLQQVLKLYTVGNLLGAWHSPQVQRSIEDVFDSPEQAHHAVATCACWVGYPTIAAPGPVSQWWQADA